MNNRIVAILVSFCFLPFFVFSQQPKHTRKAFVNYLDTTEFKIGKTKNGLHQTFIVSHITIWDVDDNNTTHVIGDQTCLINITGPLKNGVKDGVFTTFVIDSSNHAKKFKLYEQDYVNGRLNGQWRIYNLKGTFVGYQTYKNDSLDGVARSYFIDGKRIIEETEYFKGRRDYIDRTYYDNNVLWSEVSMLDSMMNGLSKEYYEDGSLKRQAVFKNGLMDGFFKYYYPGGKIWIEEIFKEGKEWTIIGNYTSDGKQREKGTLKNGNGTIILYNDDGTVREIVTLVNGERK